jgi:ribosome biogenesis GTPase / thiamine phosphate phosphatase
MAKKDFDEFLFEEEFHEKVKKELKKQKKLLKKKDQSKYKKTDIEKDQPSAPSSKKELSQGRIISISGEGTLVVSENNTYLCSVRGALKNKFSKDKNIIAIGDLVNFAIENKNTGAIIDVLDRFSTLIRVDPVRKKKQTLAANIDQVLITTSVVQPFLKPALVDRYIIATLQGNMKPIILINKIDLLEGSSPDFSKEEIENEKKLYQDFLKAYHKIGIPIIPFSCITGEGIDHLRKIMKDKASVFSGQSGTGKSSIINKILGTDLKTGAVVKKTYKGAHTTTSANLIPLEEGGFCIDTPGIKSFGLWELKKEEVKNYYPEFLPYSENCKYINCMHLNEPDCKVKQAVENNEISALRFDSYRSLIIESEEDNKNR